MSGVTVWLTGLPSVEILDGDEVRANLSPSLGFSRRERTEHVRRIGWAAMLLARNGVTVLVPVIAPYRTARADVRAMHAAGGARYVEVHVSTAVDVCRARDVKGLYRRAATGQLTELTGVDDPYEPPEQPELRIDTDGLSIDAAADAILTVLSEASTAPP